jgi:hypothetical protein
MPFLRKYNTLLVTGTTAIRIPIIKRGVVDFAVGADWTPAAGDVKILIDGTVAANVANLPTAIAGANTGVVWEFVLTAAELLGKQIVVLISDAATKAIEDQCFIVETFGNASAMHAVDYSSLTGFITSVATAVNVTNAPPDSSGVSTLLSRLTSLRATYIDNLSAGAVALASATATIIASIGAFTGGGVNNILGFFKALMRTDGSNPSDLGGTYDPTTDSLQAFRDGTGTAAQLAAVVVASIKLSKNVTHDITFSMYLSGSESKASGVTVTCQASKDRGTPTGLTGSPLIQEIGTSSGDYGVTINATDFNCNNLVLVFSAVGCKQTTLHIITQS